MSTIKGQVVSGDSSKIVVRIKSGCTIQLGELLIIDTPPEKYLLQVFDLIYASQLSESNRELLAGISLEEESLSIIDSQLRNYTLALAKPLLALGSQVRICNQLPPFFSSVRMLEESDLSFLTAPNNPFFLGRLRSGSSVINLPLILNGSDVLSHHILIPASTGKGKSNLMSCLLWDITSRPYAGMLVLDPHDEYFGRNTLGLKDHPDHDKIRYYTPTRPPPGARTLKFNIKKIRPEHFQGAISLSEPQRMCLYAYHKKFQQQWVYKLLSEQRIPGVSFHEDTLAVVKRKLISLLGLDLEISLAHPGSEHLTCTGIFDDTSGDNTISDICQDLESGRTVIIDTSYFGGSLEIMVATIIASEIFDRYKYYKKIGTLDNKPVVSIVLEEAPRVLGRSVLDQGSNMFETLAREGRKFKVGLIAITQLPSEIPKNILSNMNTKIILGLEMNSERQAVIDSSPQDITQDSRTIASLDKGEALITSTFTRCALPIKIPLFSEFVRSAASHPPSPPARLDDSFFR